MTALTIRSILVATDLTPASSELVRNAARLAMDRGAELHVIHVFDDSTRYNPEDRDLLAMQKRTHELRQRLSALLADAIPAGFQVAGSKVAHGGAAVEILRRAGEVGAELIVLGKHRERSFGDRFLGATVERILAVSSVPCLILGGEINLPPRSIVLPADLSAPSLRALRVARAWQDAFQGSELSVVRVVAPGGDDSGRGFSQVDETRRLHEALRQLEHEAPTGTRSAHVVVSSDPAEAILQFSDRAEADLLVVGTHGDGTMIRLLLGSLSSVLHRRAERPILLVPPSIARDQEAVAPMTLVTVA
jgi:nucleotide-binding universal stress UspA family protein